MKKFKSLSVVTSISKAVREGLLTMNTNFEATGKLLPSISKGMKEFRSNLSTTAKAMVGAGGFAAAFVTTKNAVSDFVEGEIEADEAIANVAITAGVTGAALYTFLGPWGLLIEAIGLAAGALVGYIDTQNRLREERLEDSFFDGVGTSIENFTERVRMMGEEVSDSTDYIRNLGETMDGNRDNIENAQRDIDYFLGKMDEAGGQLSEEDIPKMKEAFDSLYANIKENMELSSQALVYTLQEVVGKAAGAATGEIDGMIGKVYELNALLAKDADEIKRQMDKIWAKIESGTATEQERNQFDVLADQLQSVGSEATLAESKFKTAVQKINSQKIDFESPEKAKDKIEEIGDLGTQMVTELGEARDEAVRVVDSYIQQVGESLSLSDEEKKAWTQDLSDMRDAILGSFELKEEEVKGQIAETLGVIQSQFNQHKQTLVEEEKRQGKSFLDELLDAVSSDEQRKKNEEIRNKRIEADVNDQFRNIQAAIDSAAGKLDIAPDPEMGQELFDSLYNSGENAVGGMADGIRDNAGQVADAASSAAKGAQEAVKTEDDSHSPSRKYYGFGRDDMEGYRNGIRDNASLAAAAAKSAAIDTANALVSGANSQKASVSAAFGNLFNAALDKTDLFCSRMRGAINDMLAGIKDATNSVRLSPDGRISYTKLPPVKIPRLATGAVIPPNAQFAAILGDQTHGRNLEAPEGLIRQIVREESGGSLAQVEDLLERLIQVVQSKDLSVTVGFDDRDVAQAARRGEHNLGYPVRSY